jgi:hypothetical protein
MVFTIPLRIAGGLAVAGLLVCARSYDSQALRRAALMLLNGQLLAGVAQLYSPELTSLAHLRWPLFAACSLPISLAAAVSLLATQLPIARQQSGDEEAGEAGLLLAHRIWLRLLVGIALLASLEFVQMDLDGIQVAAAVGTFVTVIASELVAACETRDEFRVWCAEGLLAASIGYFALFGLIVFGSNLSLFVLVGGAFLAWTLGQLAGRSAFTAALRRPLLRTALVLPLAAVLLGVQRHVVAAPGNWLGLNSLALLLAAGFYFWRGVEESRKSLLVLSAIIVNVALGVLWRELEWHDPQFFMMPLGLSVLVVVQLLKDEIPARQHAPLRYLGALTILVSPTFHIVSGSWIHLGTLMAASVGVTLLAMGLRVRALMYTGTAFLVADLIAMVVRGSIDRPNLLWLSGIALGGAVLLLAAICEKHRESLLQRLRYLAYELEAWE